MIIIQNGIGNIIWHGSDLDLKFAIKTAKKFMKDYKTNGETPGLIPPFMVYKCDIEHVEV